MHDITQNKPILSPINSEGRAIRNGIDGEKQVLLDGRFQYLWRVHGQEAGFFVEVYNLTKRNQLRQSDRQPQLDELHDSDCCGESADGAAGRALHVLASGSGLGVRKLGARDSKRLKEAIFPEPGTPICMVHSMKKTRGGLFAVAVYVCLYRRRDPRRAAEHSSSVQFERNGRTFPGLVLEDTLVVDLAQANAAYQSGTAGAPRVAMPSDMKALIAQWADTGFRERLQTLARASASAKGRPDLCARAQDAADAAADHVSDHDGERRRQLRRARERNGRSGRRSCCRGARAGGSGSAAPEPPPEPCRASGSGSLDDKR